MLIGVDGNEANEVRPDLGVPAGVNVYAYELVKHIYKLQDEWGSKHRIVVYLKHPPSPFLPKENNVFTYKVLPGRGLWVLTRLMPYLWRGGERPDVFFSPSHYAPLVIPMPLVASIMDLGYLEFSAHLKRKDFWQLKNWTASTIRRAKELIAISESTKDDIVRHYPASRGKITVTHLSHDHTKFNTRVPASAIRRVKAKYAIGGDYVLYLSVIKPSKNVIGLIHGWSKIVNEVGNYSLVIAGKKGWAFAEIFSEVEKLNLRDRVIFTDYIAEEDKAPLIAGASLFCLPSFWEGFGLDVLNAMACGVPCALSSAGSLPEVGGSGAVYFDPTKPDEIGAAIRKVLTMKKEDYNRLAANALKQADKFSWEKTARATMKVLEKAANER